ncbi:hypothetical protein, partial [Coleofasciculus sp.]|uniref:hypothetical protein n=1 Tax=Coleofasciculus sp. TaxID=3100458 RepID=UPI003A2456BF
TRPYSGWLPSRQFTLQLRLGHGFYVLRSLFNTPTDTKSGERYPRYNPVRAGGLPFGKASPTFV